MQASSNIMWSSGRSEALLEAGLPVRIDIRPVRGAKRLRLRFDESSGTLKLTCPMRTSRRAALAWALDQRQWIEAQLARALPAEPFEAGAVIPVEGVETRIVWSEREPRTLRLTSDELRCGGPQAGLARRVEAFLKRQAIETMSGAVAAAAFGAAAAGGMPDRAPAATARRCRRGESPAAAGEYRAQSAAD